ncbi:unnamed protein product [Penicillium salamii]|uniref:Uncharacterized protein n=1 Tax=Penicillium salamii TaxID=1612424 RepID=A0A9W4JCY8_9EURO|nr:unnamed protein product [Penicillium salamii]CAG8117945.1 unnamed protein product [Penicillium salamii]CAG8279635.1 unnamed protein product [Penicillium salamii]CAG8362424.1 unnamed protein product [Penicillium salamii]CAG8365476.1 unnamed protein product [Penicillium salamii]
MNTDIEEMTCTSVDLDGFGSTADDAWFNQHTAPMDGEEETGAHPHQAAALKAYLKGESKPSETAVAMTRPHDSLRPAEERPSLFHISGAQVGHKYAFPDPNDMDRLRRLLEKTDLRDRVLGIIEDALFELPESHTPALVELLKELSQLPDEEHGEPVWRNLVSFGHSWSDKWKQSHWREALATRDPATRAKRRKAHVHLAFVEASCAMAAPGPNAEDGLLPLSWGYECISEALECQDAMWDFEVPAAVVWIKIAGERLREGARKGEKCWALERKGRLWAAGPMSMDRWNFWLKRLEQIEEIGNVISSGANEGLQNTQAQGQD